MIYFRYALDIHGWKTKPETETDRLRGPEPENRGWEIIPEPEPVRPETRGYLIRNRPIAILTHRGPRSLLPAAILLLHHDCTARSCCVVLRSPACLPVFAESACCKRMFQMFQRYVASVSYRCCKSRSGLHMLQWLYTHFASVYSKYYTYFFRRMLQVCLSGCCICFHTYVASVLSKCCIYFAMVSSVFQVFL